MAIPIEIIAKDSASPIVARAFNNASEAAQTAANKISSAMGTAAASLSQKVSAASAQAAAALKKISGSVNAANKISADFGKIPRNVSVAVTAKDLASAKSAQVIRDMITRGQKILPIPLTVKDLASRNISAIIARANALGLTVKPIGLTATDLTRAPILRALASITDQTKVTTTKSLTFFQRLFGGVDQNVSQVSGRINSRFRDVFENVAQNATGSFGSVAGGLFKLPGPAGIAAGAILGIVGALGAMALKAAQATASTNDESSRFLATINRLKSGFSDTVATVGSAVIPIFNSLAEAFGFGADQADELRTKYDATIDAFKTQQDEVLKVVERLRTQQEIKSETFSPVIEATERLKFLEDDRDKIINAIAAKEKEIATARENALRDQGVAVLLDKQTRDEFEKKLATAGLTIAPLQEQLEIAKQQIDAAQKVVLQEHDKYKAVSGTAEAQKKSFDEAARLHEQIARLEANRLAHVETLQKKYTALDVSTALLNQLGDIEARTTALAQKQNVLNVGISTLGLDEVERQLASFKTDPIQAAIDSRDLDNALRKLDQFKADAQITGKILPNIEQDIASVMEIRNNLLALKAEVGTPAALLPNINQELSTVNQMLEALGTLRERATIGDQLFTQLQSASAQVVELQNGLKGVQDVAVIQGPILPTLPSELAQVAQMREQWEGFTQQLIESNSQFSIISGFTSSIASSLENNLSNGLTSMLLLSKNTGAEFGKMVKAIGVDLVAAFARAIIKATILRALSALLPGAGGFLGKFLGAADGGIFKKPTLRVIGEAGPEAVIPLAQNKQSQRENILRLSGLTPQPNIPEFRQAPVATTTTRVSTSSTTQNISPTFNITVNAQRVDRNFFERELQQALSNQTFVRNFVIPTLNKEARQGTRVTATEVK